MIVFKLSTDGETHCTQHTINCVSRIDSFVKDRVQFSLSARVLETDRELFNATFDPEGNINGWELKTEWKTNYIFLRSGNEVLSVCNSLMFLFG